MAHVPSSRPLRKGGTRAVRFASKAVPPAGKAKDSPLKTRGIAYLSKNPRFSEDFGRPSLESSENLGFLLSYVIPRGVLLLLALPIKNSGENKTIVVVGVVGSR